MLNSVGCGTHSRRPEDDPGCPSLSPTAVCRGQGLSLILERGWQPKFPGCSCLSPAVAELGAHVRLGLAISGGPGDSNHDVVLVCQAHLSPKPSPLPLLISLDLTMSSCICFP